MSQFNLLFVFIVAFCSCSSHSGLLNIQGPPRQSELAGFERLNDYIQAKNLIKTDKTKACDSFLALSQNQDFVLRDVAYVRSLQTCEPSATTDWNRTVPTWLEKEKQLTYFKSLTAPIDRGLFVQKYPQYFTSPEKIETLQRSIGEPGLSDDQKKSLTDTLYSLAPRFMPNPEVKDQFRMVRDYRSVRDFEKTRNLLKKIIANPKNTLEERWQAHKELVSTNKLQKNQKKNLFFQSVEQWAQFLKPNQLTTPTFQQLSYEAQLNHARVVWTEDGAEPGLKILQKIEDSLKGKLPLNELYWLRARMFEEKKSHSEALIELEKALQEKSVAWKDLEKIHWTLAWSYFKEKNYEACEKHLDTMLDNKETTPFARFKYLYWKAETQARRNQAALAQKTWQQVIEEDLFGYYNLLAHFQLKRPLRAIAIPQIPRQTILSTDDELVFLSLQNVDELELASKMLASKSPETASLKSLSGEKLASLFFLYSTVKNYKYIFQVFNQLPYDLQKDVFLRIPRVLFPEVYVESMEEASAKTGMERELIYSIMRQESSFDPQARSPMDAFGLLQILPEVAKSVARSVKIPFNGYEDLFDEKKNILIGSQLLKKQIQLFDNKFVLYVASYNASSSAVRGWYKRAQASELDDIMFIEEIPYEETKAYVKLVMRNFLIYKKLKHGDEFQEFPRHLLDLK